ncbi:hypothetical protein HK405_002012 [Cladochytrium tenue]|nr:hypothetical protein HK405_002012 [Cladochytrium tenue]
MSKRGSTPATDAMRRVLDEVAKHTEKGRVISELFMELVSRRDYPDYYQVIAKPVSIETIKVAKLANLKAKIEKGEYNGSFAGLEQDFKQMVSNAMTYNRKGSENVFNSALNREKTHMEEVEQSRAEERDSPIAPTAEKLRSLLKKIMTFKNESGYPMFENFFELPDAEAYPDYYEKIKSPLAFDGVRKKINAKEYKQLEEFEADIRLIATNAREYNIEGSSIYKESVQLEKYFLSLLGKEADLKDAPSVSTTPVESIEAKGDTFKSGDYVYLSNPNSEAKPTIAQIVSTFLDERKNPSFVANWFLRPEQTVHKASMKFVENEVLKSNRSETYLADDIIGRCWVLFIKDFVRGKPKGADMAHVYACEHRYNDQAKAISRIKQWNVPPKFKDPELELYDSPLTLTKVASVFAHAEESAGGPKKRKQSEDAISDMESGWHGDDTSEVAEHVHEEKRIKLIVKAPGTTRKEGPGANEDHHSGLNIPALTFANVLIEDVDNAASNARSSGSRKGPDTADRRQSTSDVSSSGRRVHGVAGNGESTSNAVPEVTPEPPRPIFLSRPPRLFDRTADGDLKWYAGPPLDVVPPHQASHSLQYIQWKLKKQQKSAGRENDVVADNDLEATADPTLLMYAKWLLPFAGQ